MSERANTLADRIEQGAKSLAAFVGGLSESEWNTVIPKEDRSVGNLVHHVANMYQVEIDLASQLAEGKPITGVTMAVVDGINAEHAKEHANPAKKDTLVFLQEQSAKAATRVRKFSDEDLDAAASISLNADAPLTAQFFIEDHALQHSFLHLDNIKEVLVK